MLPFAPKTASQLSQILTTRRRTPDIPVEAPSHGSTREPSEEPSQKSPTPSSRQPSSLASSRTPSSRHKDTIEAKKRVAFEVDFARIGQEYSYGKRTHRSIKNSRVSWIYLHGMELASKENKDKHWICKLCYEAGKPKVLVASSTASASRHLLTHDLYPPGQRPIQ
jgi:hypothetical protein